MKYKLILLSLLVLPIFIHAHGQEGRDLLAEYCQNNWIRDPTTCADYIPEDYEERKAEYQAQEAEKIRQETLQSKLEQESARLCPLGSHISTDQFGTQICVDSKTNQFVGYPNTGKSDFDDNGIIIGIVAFIVIIVVIVLIIKSRKSTSIQEKFGRQDFTEAVKRQVLQNQRYKCNMCKKPIGLVGARQVWFDFDHKDGNNWNNDINNCQALCKNCHSYKTERDR